MYLNRIPACLKVGMDIKVSLSLNASFFCLLVEFWQMLCNIYVMDLTLVLSVMIGHAREPEILNTNQWYIGTWIKEVWMHSNYLTHARPKLQWVVLICFDKYTCTQNVMKLNNIHFSWIFLKIEPSQISGTHQFGIRRCMFTRLLMFFGNFWTFRSNLSKVNFTVYTIHC